MRGFKDINSARMIMSAWLIHYNYIRPHQSLAGATPSDIACVDLQLGNNKWLDLIKKSLSAISNLPTKN